jgi:hypothetical protein
MIRERQIAVRELIKRKIVKRSRYGIHTLLRIKTLHVLHGKHVVCGRRVDVEAGVGYILRVEAAAHAETVGRVVEGIEVFVLVVEVGGVLLCSGERRVVTCKFLHFHHPSLQLWHRRPISASLATSFGRIIHLTLL